MSDQGDTTVATPAPEIQVPKHRLDEEIQNKRQLQAQVQNLSELVANLTRRQEPQQAPRKAPKELEALKQRDPDAFKLFMDQERRSQMLEHKLKEVSAGQFAQHDRTDAETLVQVVGLDEANKYAGQIEPKLKELRERGIHHLSRTDLYKLIKGDEALRSRTAPKAATTTAKSTPANVDAPGSDPSQLGSVSVADSTPTGESLEDLEKRLENITF